MKPVRGMWHCVGVALVWAAVLTLIPGARKEDAAPRKEARTLSAKQASAFAALALAAIRKEYPNKPADVLNSGRDVKAPRAMHPAFYGSFDWHSSVHGHWMLVRLLRRFPDLPQRKEIRAALAGHLTAKNLKAEADYFAQPNRRSFERTYGWPYVTAHKKATQAESPRHGRRSSCRG